jgi:hypothetical protein
MRKKQPVASWRRKERGAPHWPTFCSLATALCSLGLGWLIYSGNQKLNRPFISVKYDQRKPGLPSRNDTGGIGPPVQAWGILSLQNLGNSLAYDIDFQLFNTQLECPKYAVKYTIAARDTMKLNPFVCMSVKNFYPNVSVTSFYPIDGRVQYRDSFGNRYDEPISIQVQVGGTEMYPNKFPE